MGRIGAELSACALTAGLCFLTNINSHCNYRLLIVIAHTLTATLLPCHKELLQLATNEIRSLLG